ncbi:MAG: hypothetical protein IPG64_24460 [Haliea sp.]|nr:hypothetical protein [Haliea sp.]
MRKVLVLLLLMGVVAATQSEVKVYMDQMLEQIFVLKPFIASDASFEDPDNSAQISAALTRMAQLSAQIKHEEMISKSGFAVSGAALQQQLEEVVSVFDNGNKGYALWTLRSTLGVCMACHTQLPAVSTRFTAMNADQVLANPFEEAEFLFVIRNFDAAMPLYSKAITGYPGDEVDISDVEQAIYRQLYYYLRVARDPLGLAVALQDGAANTQLPARLREQMERLRAAALSAQDRVYPQFTQSQTAEVRQYAESMMNEELVGDVSLDSPEAAIAALKLSSVLYEYLNAHPDTPLKADILYWLSFCERRYQSMQSLPDLYLRQCVLEHPASPVANQCLADYVDSVTLAFTGSGGTHIPDDVMEELNRMRALVKEQQ